MGMSVGGDGGECARSEGEIPPSTEAFRPIGLIRHNGCPNLSGDTRPKAGEKLPGELFVVSEHRSEPPIVEAEVRGWSEVSE